MKQELQVFKDNTRSIVLSDKVARAAIAASVIVAAQDGEINPLVVLESIRAWEEVFNHITGDKDFQAALLDEMAKHGKSATIYGHRLEQAEAGVKYDYSRCGDTRINAINAEIAALQDELRQRQEYLKSLPEKGLECVDEDTGEVYTLYPPVRKSKTIVKVTLK